MNEFNDALALITTVTGLTFPASRMNTVVETFHAVMKDRGLHSSAALTQAIRNDAVVRDMIVARLTIGETYFFRDPAQFAVIREIILPSLRSARPGRTRIRMWSAASASGEEAYSLAIMSEEQGIAARTDIIATDIARPRLAAAQKGSYGKWSMRGVPDDTIARYFRKQDDRFVISQHLRDRVSFRYLNLAEDRYPSLSLGIYDVDIILCRNVLIYFDQDTVCRVAERLLDSLSAHGWLLLGASDPPLQQMIECDVVTTAAGVMYRRAGNGGADAVRSVVSFPNPYEQARIPESLPAPQLQPAIDADAPLQHGANSAFGPVQAANAEVVPALQATAIVPPGNAEATVMQGDMAASIETIRSLCNLGRTRDAAERAIEALERHPAAAELHYLLAVALSHEGRNKEAATAARRALYIDHDMLIAHVLLGQLQSRMHERDAALRSFRNAVRLIERMSCDAVIPFTDGERADRILEIVNMQMRLLKAVA